MALDVTCPMRYERGEMEMHTRMRDEIPARHTNHTKMGEWFDQRVTEK